MKSEFSTVKESSIWLIGDGTRVNFWTDYWNGAPIYQQLLISHHWSIFLTTKVCDFIIDGHWEIPTFIQDLFPNPANFVLQVTLSVQQSPATFMEAFQCWHIDP